MSEVDIEPAENGEVTESFSRATVARAGEICSKCAAGRIPDDQMACQGPIWLANTPLCPVTQERCVSIVMERLRCGRGGWIVTLNLDHVRRCCHDPRYAQAVRDADLRVADGMPLVWASGLQGTPLPERVAGSDLIWSLSSTLAKEHRSIYLLGGEASTADAAAAILSRSYPGLVISGTDCPPVGFEHDPVRMTFIADNLLASRPDLVFVALGSPKQEHLIESLRPLLPGTWWIGVGISFSFVVGRVRRAPRWMQRCGLEWAHRLAQEPGRLGKRYLVDGIPFGLRLLLRSLMRRSGEPTA